MEKKNKIIKQFKKKIENLKKHNRLYFANDDPQISDSDYDKLKSEILKSQKKYDYLKKSFNIDNIVGTPPSNKFKKIKHLKPMLSLSNAFQKSDMEDFNKKINNFLNLKDKKINYFLNQKLMEYPQLLFMKTVY